MESTSGTIDIGDKKLGTVFCDLPFNKEQQDRIANLLASDSLPRAVLQKYGSKTLPYKVFEKKERIPGFRPGSATKLLMNRIMEYLKMPAARQYQICWDIYKYAVIECITTELVALNQLLAEVVYNGAVDDANDLFKCICRNAAEYEVNATDVRKLYELWWTARVDHFEEVLSTCSQIDETRVQARQISKLSKSIDELKTACTELSECILDLSTAEKQARELAAKDRERIQANQSSINAVEGRISELATVLTGSTKSRFQIIDEKLKILTEALTDLKKQAANDERIRHLEAELQKVLEGNKEGLISVQTHFSDMIAQASSDWANKVQELEQTQANLMEQITSKLDKETGQSINQLGLLPYKSPLSRTTLWGAAPFKITKEIDFLNSWSTTLERAYQLSVPSELLVAYHALLLSNHIIISDYKLIETWINCLGWWRFVRQMVASPLWSREEDWADGIDHLFKDGSSAKAPRIVIIHNYDAGVVDCYLVPSLVLWALRARIDCISTKLFLIPAQPSTAASSQVLDHAAHIGQFNSQSATKLRFKEKDLTIASISTEILTGVEPSIAEQWLQPASSATYDLSVIQKPFNLELNRWLIKNFQNTVSYAGKYLQESSAAGVGVYHHILPWVQSRYESEYDAIRARVSELPDIAY